MRLSRPTARRHHVAGASRASGASRPHRRATALFAGACLALAACGGGAVESEGSGENGGESPQAATATTAGEEGATESAAETEASAEAESVAETGATAESGSGSGSEASGSPEQVTLSAVTSFPRDSTEYAGYRRFIDNLTEAAPWIEMDYRGASDVIPGPQQAESAASGAVDLAAVPGTYYVQNLPVANGMLFTPYLPGEEREQGVYDLLSTAHTEELGVQYLGKVYAGVPHRLFLKPQIEEPDLNGLTLRASPGQAPIIKGLGGAVSSLPVGETYTALERGAVDGFGYAEVGVADSGWQDLVNYEVLPAVYEASITVLVNQQKWESLSPRTQEVMGEVMRETEPEIVELYDELAAEDRNKRAEAGVELTEFTGDERQRMLETAYGETVWNDTVPENPRLEELRELFTSGYGDNYETAVPGASGE